MYTKVLQIALHTSYQVVVVGLEVVHRVVAWVALSLSKACPERLH